MRKLLPVIATAVILVALPACDSGRSSIPGRPGNSLIGSEKTTDLLVRVDSLAEQAWYASAGTAYEALTTIFEKEANWDGYIKSRTGTGRVMIRIGNYESAAQLLAETATEAKILLPPLDPENGAVLSELGRAYVRLGRYEEAETNFIQALTIIQHSGDGSHVNEGIILHELGLVAQERGDYDEALQYYEKALIWYHEYKYDVGRQIAKTYNNLGNVFWKKGRYREALDTHLKALSIKDRVLPPQDPSRAVTLSNIGNQYQELADHNKARQFYELALAIQTESAQFETLFQAYTHHSLARSLSFLESLTQAEDHLRKAFSIKVERIGQNHPSTANTLLELGKVLIKMDRVPEGLIYLHRAKSIMQRFEHPTIVDVYRSLALAHQLSEHEDSVTTYFDKAVTEMVKIFGPGPHPTLATIRNDRAEWRLVKADFAGALAEVQKSLHANISGFSSNDPFINPSLSEALSEIELIRSLNIKAISWMGLREKGVSEETAYDLAIANLEKAGRILDNIRFNMKDNRSKQIFAAQSHDIFFDGLELSTRMYHLSSNPRFLHLAFRFAEWRKDRISLDTIIDADIKATNVEEEYSTMHSESPAMYTTKQFAKNDLFSSGNPFRRERTGTSASSIVSIRTVQTEILDAKTALVEYVLESDTLFIFAMTQDTLASVGVSIPRNLNQVVDSLKWGITRGYADWYLRYGHYLHRLLIHPIENLVGKRDLLIVPEGILNYIPFEALLTSPVLESYQYVRYSDLPYLIKQRGVSYAHSATLLHYTSSRNTNPPQKDLFALAPGFEEGITLDSNAKKFLFLNGVDTTATNGIVPFLPGSRDEVLGIGRMLSASSGLLGQFVYNKSEILIDKDATEASLKSASLKDYKFLHFATHSFVNDHDDNLSGMLLLPGTTRDGRVEDGVLYTNETYSLELNAELVVLSACKTGIGQITEGEGMTGFSRGFLIAGAKNLVVSLWPSDDAGTKYLMLEFYKNMILGESIRDSLRHAKLRLIELGGVIAKPYFWSPFIQIGAS